MEGLKSELKEFFENSTIEHDGDNDAVVQENTTKLLPHQKIGIKWMVKREKQGKPKGGILADDMGLGKTLTLLMLISNDNNINFKTLIVCPLSLMNHWIEENEKHKLNLTILKYYQCKNMELLHDYNIVLTTYNTVMNHYKQGVQDSFLFLHNWHRVVLDEAHCIKNHKTLLHQSICKLKSNFRWCVTGTPIHNQHWDMFSMLNFLKCKPFDNKIVWKMMNENKSSARIKSIVNKIVLKRNKIDINLNIPESAVKYINTQFKNEEKVVYDELKRMSSNAYETAVTSTVGEVKKEQMKKCIWLILKLRQMCCHPHLLTKTSSDAIESVKKKQPEIFDLNYFSSKCIVVLDIIEKVLTNTADKIVLASQWVDYLSIYETILNQKNIKTLMYNGKLNIKQRALVETTFNSPLSEHRILLMSIKCGGVGLNLVGGNHLIMLEPHWNPQIELQAQDRINRMGQQKPTKIYKMLNINDNSIELYMNTRQRQKLDFVNSVFDKTSPTFEDIKNFFEF
ncbi:GTA [Parapoynx stagnalis nucleopolyhedrovirus]|uniref:GTA n=1 Tax=Parapoynx stagnalis nucleopolyhedrovirus TaxID=2993413 RepID=A0A9E7Y5W5_9ABAC|nr:GTA [Parapoynx stagnalis nucleopolyhedrovirus]